MDRGRKAAPTQFGDLQIIITDLGGEHSGPVAVAMAKPFLVALSTEHGSDLQLDHLLQPVAHQLRDQLPSCAAIQ